MPEASSMALVGVISSTVPLMYSIINDITLNVVFYCNRTVLYCVAALLAKRFCR